MENLLLLHGAIGAKDQLTRIATLLEKEFIVHTLNFIGHGGEPLPDNFSIPNFADQVLTYLEAQQLQNVNVFGYSMGGFIALYLATQHPSRVKKMITLATKFYWDPATSLRESAMLNPATILEKLPTFAAQLITRHQPNNWQAVLAKTRDMLHDLGEKNPLPLSALSHVSAECLLLLGDKDRMVTREETLAVKQSIPGCQMEILPDTAHPIEQVNPNLLCDTIKAFLVTTTQEEHDSTID